MAAASGRAAQVLERLARDQLHPGDPRGTQEVGADEAGGGRSGPRFALPDLLRWRRSAVVLAVLGVAVTAALLVWDRRPPPIEERLPRAAEEVAASGATGADEQGVSSADPVAGAEPGTPERPAGEGAQGEVFVHVAGAVTSPGVVQLPSTGRVVDAVRAAGGLRADADPDRVNLAAPLVDGQRIVVPVLGQEVPVEVLPTGPPGGATGAAPSAAGAGGTDAAAPVDLNTADAAQLEALPGIGPATATAILSHREQHGPFRSVEDLIEVRGIGEAKLDALRDLVAVGGS